MKICILFILVFCFSQNLKANAITKGFEALKIYNYFEAKRIFEKKIKKFPAPCAYGLAIIYYRKDNPFHHIDSAFKYILKTEINFKNVSNKLKLELNKYQFNELQVLELKRNISSAYFELALYEDTERSYQDFLTIHPWANERFVAIHKRDSIAFYNAMRINSSVSFLNFIKKYPDSEFSRLAQDEVYLKEFEELTSEKTLEQYINFLKIKPKNPYSVEAENQIFKIQTRINTLSSYSNFITNFPTNRNVTLAWRKLFQIYMYDYSENRIEMFKGEYPDYPFQKEIEEELALSKQILLPYKNESYFGWMNDQGELITQADFEGLSLYKEGLAQAVRIGKVGFVDKNNQTIIPFEFDEASDFEDGRALVEKNNKVGIIERTGKMIFEIAFDDIGLFSEDLVYAKKDSLFGYYNKFGQQVIPERFDEAFSFKNGLAQVVIKGFQNYIDNFGNLIFPLKHELLAQLNENLFIFQENDYFGLYDRVGNVVQVAKYDEISNLSEGRIAFSINGKIGYFDENGIQKIMPIFDSRTNISNFANFSGGYARAILKNKWGIIDLQGKWVVQANYSKLGEISDLVSFKKDVLWGYIDLSNKILIPAKYDEARSFDNGIAIVSFNNRYGLINSKGVIVVPIIFDDIQKLDDKFYVSKSGDKLTLLYRDGTTLTNESYHQIRFLNKNYLILTNDFDFHYFFIPEMRLIKAKK